MEYIVKIYQKQDSISPLAQIGDILDIVLDEDITGVTSCDITLPKNTPNISQFRKVEVYEVGELTDTRVFIGYIANPTIYLDKIVISCQSEKSLLAKKFVTQDRLITASTVGTIMTTLFNDWNTLYSEDWSIDTSFAVSEGIEVKKGDNFYDILNELATRNNAVWDCKDRVVTFDEVIGIDYTNPSNFKELVYNGGNPIENNIDDVKYVSYSTISNVIIGDDGTDRLRVQDATSISEVMALGEYINFRPGNLSNNVATYLANKKLPQFTFEISVSPFLFEANVGDKVALRIENVSDYMDFTGSVFINKKKSYFINKTKITEYSISDIYVSYNSFVKRFLAVESGLALKNVR